MTQVGTATAGSGFHLFTFYETSQTAGTPAIPSTNEWLMLSGQTMPMLSSEWNVNINTPHQLQLAAFALGASYTLENNINLSPGLNNASEVWLTNQATSVGAGFTPIGTASSPFTGTLNGNNYTINNLYSNTPVFAAVYSGAGLFGTIGAATIEDVGLINPYVIGTVATFGGGVGSLVGSSVNGGAAATIEDSYAVNAIVVGKGSGAIKLS